MTARNLTGVSTMRRGVAVGAAAAWLLVGAVVPANATPPVHTAGGTATTVTSGTTLVSGADKFDGGYLDFSVGEASSGETLSLPQSGSPSTASGVVSVVGAGVYLGDGSSATLIGSIDETYDGAAGTKLRVNFTSPFANPSFEDGTTGWTAINSRVDVGSTTLAGYTSSDTVSWASRIGGGGGTPPNQDNSTPISMGTYTAAQSSSDRSDGTYSLRMESTGITTNQGYDVVHGPAAYSSEFSAAAGDVLYFDWRAAAGDDAYDVFGYLLNTSTGAQTEVLDAVGNSSSATTSWATASATVPTSGTSLRVRVS